MVHFTLHMTVVFVMAPVGMNALMREVEPAAKMNSECMQSVLFVVR